MLCLAELQLQHFTPIFQLLAGVCLLFFYDDILKTVTVNNARVECLKEIDHIKFKLQQEFPLVLIEELNSIIDCNFGKGGELIAIPALRRTVSNCGRLLFVLYMALMLVTSHESGGRSVTSYVWPLIATGVYLILLVWALYHRDSPKYAKYWYFIWPAAVISAIFLAGFLWQEELPLNTLELNPWTCIYLILSAFPIAFVMVITAFFFDERRAQRMNRSLKKLSKSVDTYKAWAISPSNGLYYGIDKSLRDLFPRDAELPEAEEVVKQAVAEKLKEINRTFKTSYQVFVEPCKKLQRLCRYAKTQPRVFAFKVSGLLLVALYLTIIVQLIRIA